MWNNNVVENVRLSLRFFTYSCRARVCVCKSFTHVRSYRLYHCLFGDLSYHELFYIWSTYGKAHTFRPFLSSFDPPRGPSRMFDARCAPFPFKERVITIYNISSTNHLVGVVRCGAHIPCRLSKRLIWTFINSYRHFENTMQGFFASLGNLENMVHYAFGWGHFIGFASRCECLSICLTNVCMQC